MFSQSYSILRSPRLAGRGVKSVRVRPFHDLLLKTRDVKRQVENCVILGNPATGSCVYWDTSPGRRKMFDSITPGFTFWYTLATIFFSKMYSRFQTPVFFHSPLWNNGLCNHFYT